MINLLGQIVTNKLGYLNHQNKDNYGHNHDWQLETLIAIADSNITKATATDGSGHS